MKHTSTIAAILIASVLAAPVVHAQDAPATDRPISLKIPSLVFVGAATADWFSTVHMLNNGWGESNPTLRWAQDSPAAVVALGAAQDVLTLWVVHKFLAPNHPKIAATVLFGLSGYRVGLAFDNFRDADRREAVRRLNAQVEYHFELARRAGGL